MCHFHTYEVQPHEQEHNHPSVVQCNNGQSLSTACKAPSTLKNKNQLDATYYFIVLLIGSTCFGHYYANHQELTTIMLLPHWTFHSWVAVGWKLGAGCRL